MGRALVLSIVALEVVASGLSLRAWRTEAAFWTRAVEQAPLAAPPRVNLVRALGVASHQADARAQVPAAWRAIATDPAPLRERSQDAFALEGLTIALAQPDQPGVDPAPGFIDEDRAWLATASQPRWWTARPLTRLTLRLEAIRDARIGEYRAVNLLVHLLSAVLVWKMTASKSAAAIWACLPWHVETVMTLSGRGELLAGVGILTCCGGLSRQRWGLALLGAVVAAMAKESAVILIGLVPLWLGRVALTELGLVALCAVCVWHRDVARLPYVQPGAWAWARAQATALWMHLLTLARPLVYVEPRLMPGWRQILALGSLPALTVGALAHRWARPALAFGVTWTLIALLPRFLVPTPDAYLHARHLYVPSMGLAWCWGRGTA